MLRNQTIYVAAVCLLLGVVLGSFFVGLPTRPSMPQAHAAGQGVDKAPPAGPKELTSYRDVVKKVLPAVVSIEWKNRPKAKDEERRPAPEGMQRRPPAEFFEEPPLQGFGSGVVIDPKGVVLTNYHVVAGADQVEVLFKDGKKFLSKDIRFDRKTDLAIVRIESKTALPALELGDSNAMEIGDRVLAVGAPFGLIGSVTHGIISGKDRSLNLNLYEDFIQTDAAINPGNSGGPLVNLEGQVIGITAAIKSKSGAFQGVGLAISSNLARTVAPQLAKDGVVRRGYLGVQIKELDRAVAARLGLKEEEGVLVSVVFKGSPAEKAGIQAGDVITAIGDKTLKTTQDLQRLVALLPVNQEVNVFIWRDGKAYTAAVTIVEQPEDLGAERGRLPGIPTRDKSAIVLEKFGLEIANLPAEQAEGLGFKADATGALVTGVELRGLADRAGLRRGALITHVDKKPVTNAATAREAIEKGDLDKGILLQTLSPLGGAGYAVLKAD